MSDPFLNELSQTLKKRQARSQFRQLTTFEYSTSSSSSTSGTDHIDYIDFSSNDFLSLSVNQTLFSSFVAEITSNFSLREGSDTTSSSIKRLGSGGSRLLDGNSKYAESLENYIAKFHGSQSGLIFNSGFDANVSIFTCLPQPGDIVVYDEYIHASVHDGMRASRAKERYAFLHNVVDDGELIDNNMVASWKKDKLRGLKQTLQMIKRKHENGKYEKIPRVFVAVESVYSMDGDTVPLKEVVECVRSELGSIYEEHKVHDKEYLEYNGLRGYLIVDEAHATGVLGSHTQYLQPGSLNQTPLNVIPGRGLVNDLGLESQIFLRVHTFGKGLSSTGSIVLCTPAIREYLVNYARPFIYSTSLPFFSLASIKCSYEFLGTSEHRALHRSVWEISKYLHDEMARQFPDTGLPAVNQLGQKECVQVKYIPPNAATPQSSIFSLLCPGDASTRARSLAKYCQGHGYVVRPIVYPTVPQGTERIRICVHSLNTADQVNGLLDCVNKWIANTKQAESKATKFIRREPILTLQNQKAKL